MICRIDELSKRVDHDKVVDMSDRIDELSKMILAVVNRSDKLKIGAVGISLSNAIANIALKIFCGSKSHAPFISIVILEIGRTVAGISWHKHS